MDKKNSSICQICEKNFSRKDNMQKHMRVVHGQEPVLSNLSKIKCTNCYETFQSMDRLRSHITSEHVIIMEFEDLDFPTFEDFLIWKESTEKESWCSYILHRPAFTSASHVKTSRYMCHRSGFYNTQSTDQRNLKTLGSKKLNGFCPAEMVVNVSEDTGFVKIKYYKTHYGHDDGYGHFFMTQNERKEIAEQLETGVDMERILDNVRSSSCFDNFQRIHLIKRKDLHNIIRDFHINHKEKLHENDCVSVKLWVQLMQQVEDPPVALYKEQGSDDISGILKKEDFELVIMTKFQKKMLLKFGSDKVCIDSTHGTNAYDFSLTTLLVVDEFGAGFPVAFCISNRIDSDAMKVFFEAVKSQTGVITANIFMSDDAPAYYNAWKVVMGAVAHQLLCNWHIDRNWRKNLTKIKEATPKKVMVYKTLRVLMQEINKDKFEELMRNALDQLLSDQDTREFGLYFEEFYFKRPELWAFCHRAHLGINTNMYLESLHKTLKHIYLEGKKVKRLDKTLFTLMKFTRDKVFERLNKVIKKTPSKKIGNIRNSHTKSDDIIPSMIKLVSDGEWEVSSSASNAESYRVEKVTEPICIANCFLKCEKCNICVHMYKCTCIDNVVRYNICKHIHACQKFNTSFQTYSSEVEESDTAKISDVLQSLNQSSVFNSDNEKFNIIMKKLKMCEDVLLLNKPSNDDVLQKINCHLDNVLSLANKSTGESNNYVPNPSTSKEPPNKKIQPQMRFKSTKRKRTSQANLTISKPLVNERRSIVEGLMQPSKETAHVHAGFDHVYSK